MLIALSGGSPREREAIAQRLVGSRHARLVEFSRPAPKGCYGVARASVLESGLGRLSARARPVGVVVTHCLSEQEAALVRTLGGAVWHLYSRPSAMVVIRNGDAIVTGGEDGFQHVRSPLEALSELLLAKAG